MSRKNNRQRRKVQQSFDQRREEELKAKQEAKRERKAANHEAKQAAAAPPAAVVPQAHALSVASNGVSKPQRKQKQKGFRVKKNGEELAQELQEAASVAGAAALCFCAIRLMRRRREALVDRGDALLATMSVGLLGFAVGASLLAAAAEEEDESDDEDDD